MSHVVYFLVVSRTELHGGFRQVIGATSATGGNRLRHTECRGCVSVGTGDFDSLPKVSLSIDVGNIAVTDAKQQFVRNSRHLASHTNCSYSMPFLRMTCSQGLDV